MLCSSSQSIILYNITSYQHIYIYIYMEGYAKLASLMGAHPEVAIFRRFGALGVQNLLYLQAELVALEDELRQCSLANESSGDIDRVAFAKDWFTLASYDGGNERQWAIVLRIRQKLKDYGA